LAVPQIRSPGTALPVVCVFWSSSVHLSGKPPPWAAGERGLAGQPKAPRSTPALENAKRPPAQALVLRVGFGCLCPRSILAKIRHRSFPFFLIQFAGKPFAVVHPAARGALDCAGFPWAGVSGVAIRLGLPPASQTYLR
jgi:hypothetical protein